MLNVTFGLLARPSRKNLQTSHQPARAKLMIDSYLIPPQERVLRHPARWLLGLGVSANALTLTGFVIGLGALPAIALGNFWLALLLMAINRVLDGLDGAVARQAGPTDRGAFLDIALDFFFYASIPFAFVLADPAANGVAGALLLFSFIGTSSSFLAFAVIAKQRGMTALAMPKKGIYYLGGITEGAETIALFVLICLFPALFPIAAIAFAALAFLTTAIRWWWGWTSFDAK
ncbi:CDP-alcohol phosphatidyltransferase family protein [Devosia neptuniae]|uniref:CDP-alcohol phosphatidyltransferase family protein n=1 Tax=Devosia TaxID=46913 RepID=UPI0022B03D57|nr:CDP-alcohol phosphatidyltransferase family protein [Devosia neptuniae]MCZ4347010.1 CDP-alcohol phosphatidyltransferase family protein [Devosia neptuniae]